uniref:Uncharacterized protein n=1 Tax=Oryza meridionalis TaxID=40149 RepID=A0A0E0DBF7_9ORYZ
MVEILHVTWLNYESALGYPRQPSIRLLRAPSAVAFVFSACLLACSPACADFREAAVGAAVVLLLPPPIDLFLFTMEDAKIFQGYYLFQTIMFREGYYLSWAFGKESEAHDHAQGEHSIINDDQGNGIETDNSSTTFLSANDQSVINSYKDHKEMLLQILHDAQRYSAFRKGLAMIDICQLKNDPEEVLKWLKSSTGWSVLHNSELRIGLKDENVVLDKINAELCSELEKNIGTFDWALMSQYYYKARLSNFARQCAIQARASGVILIKQALPIRETWKEQKQSTNPKVSKLSLEDCLGSLRRPLRRINEQFGRGAARGKPWQLAAFASIATAATVGMSSTR